MTDDRRTTSDWSGDPEDSRADTEGLSGESGVTPVYSSSLSPGQVIGPYRIERLLGSGGMGEVYAAEHLDSGHRLAVKVLPSSRTWSPELRTRFAREGLLAATIDHPNSLYVYGTTDANGVPLIAMELAAGGTLQDVLETEGVMPVAAAVDAILQVIAGLQAAYEAGILHRDVKPANCFVDRDGVVKIGDYGLSLPTATATDTRLTMHGMILATPAFAPPEQIRGEDVDARTDIYAVGATLYNLLTGKLPLTATGNVQMIAAVLQQVPGSPRKLRSEIPEALAAVILRCLEKKPAERFQNYSELSHALLPFSSAVPEEAPTGVRFGTGLIDLALLVCISAAALPFGIVNVASDYNSLHGWLWSIAASIVYAIPEVLWGQSPGKRINRLRVVRTDGQRASRSRLLLRNAVFLSPGLLIEGVGCVGPSSSPVQNVLVFLSMIAPLLPFLPWTRSGRKRGWHDRLSETMVVRVRDKAAEYAMPVSAALSGAHEYAYVLGPYSVSSDPAHAQVGQILQGLDRTLQRKVWIVVQPADAARTPAIRRDLSRGTRLRWLNGRRSDELSWDAYEAPAGHSLLSASLEPVPWVVARTWIERLAGEVEQVLREGSATNVLSPERVWIRPGGKVLLLDFVPPDASHFLQDRSPGLAASLDERTIARDFLSRVARRALLAADDPEPGSLHPPELPLPLHLSRALSKLSRGEYATCGALIQDLRASARRPEAIGRRRRVLQFAVPAVFVLSLALPPVLIQSWIGRTNEREHPGYIEAVHCLSELRRLERATGSESERDKQDLRIYLTGRLSSVLEQADAVTVMMGTSRPLFNEWQRRYIADALRVSPSPSAEAVQQARERLFSVLDGSRMRMREIGYVAKASMVVGCYLIPLMVIFGAVLGGGLSYRLFGIGVVTDRGRVASRKRLLARSLLTWAPGLLVLCVALVLHTQSDARSTSVGVPEANVTYSMGRHIAHSARHLAEAVEIMYATPLVLLLLGIGYAIARPQRSIQDRLVGTYLVPR